MKAVTGIVVGLEGNNQQVSKIDGQLGYLENNIEGGGILRELEDNRQTLKAKLRRPGGKVSAISVPSPNVLKIGDVVSVIQDDDGCEFYYENHSSDRTWQFPRYPAHERRLTKFARAGINWGLFGGILVGLFAGFAYGQSMGLNLTAAALIAIAITSMVWSLRGRPRAARRHLESARVLVQDHRKTHLEFIDINKDAALSAVAV